MSAFLRILDKKKKRKFTPHGEVKQMFKKIEITLIRCEQECKEHIKESLATAMGIVQGGDNLKIYRMSCFPKIFGRKKKQKFPPTEEVIRNLEDNEAILTKQQENLEKQIEDCISTAKTNAIKNKRVALRALQSKKRLENKLQQIQDRLTTLVEQKDAIEAAKMNAEIIVSINKTRQVIKKANKKLDSDKVQRLMDDISQQHEVGNEISKAIRNSVVLDVDEDELAKELDQLQNEVIKQRLPSIPMEVDIVFAGNEEDATKEQSKSATTTFSATMTSAND